MMLRGPVRPPSPLVYGATAGPAIICPECGPATCPTSAVRSAGQKSGGEERAREGQRRLTSELRLRRAKRGSGEHRRQCGGAKKAVRDVWKSVASPALVGAPVSQL